MDRSASPKQRLHQAGLKITTHRLDIINVLQQAHAPDINQIHQTLTQEGKNIDLATIYRTLETFKTQGMVKELNFNEGKARFELTTSHHHHLICQGCGGIEIYDRSDLSAIEQDINTHHQFYVTSHHLEFFGLCRHCH